MERGWTSPLYSGLDGISAAAQWVWALTGTGLDPGLDVFVSLNPPHFGPLSPHWEPFRPCFVVGFLEPIPDKGGTAKDWLLVVLTLMEEQLGCVVQEEVGTTHATLCSRERPLHPHRVCSVEVEAPIVVTSDGVLCELD